MKTLLLILALSQPKKDSTWVIHHLDVCKCYCSRLLYIRKGPKEYEYLVCMDEEPLELTQGDKIAVLKSNKLEYKGRILNATFQREISKMPPLK